MSEMACIQAEMELVPGNVKAVVKPFRQGSVDIYMVSLDAIRLRPSFNHARESDPEYEAHIRELADSIKANGFYRHKPLTVFAAAKVSNLLSLVGAPKPIRDMVTSGKVSATTAMKTMRERGADAAGKPKVMPRMLDSGRKSQPGRSKHADTERLDWIVAQGGVIIREWYREGQERYFEVLDRNDDVRLGQGADIRSAIDEARI
jgi:hypothetical protein